MADNSKIEWCDTTWNPLRGCSKVSRGCENCYAMSVAARFSGPGQPYEGLAHRVGGKAQWTNKIRLVEEHLTDPLRWMKPRRIFVNSMSDLFHEDVPDEYIAAIFAVMHACPLHTFQVLTKRPQRMMEWTNRIQSDYGCIAKYVRQNPKGLSHYFDGHIVTEEIYGKQVRSGKDPWCNVFNAAGVQYRGPLCNVWLGVSVEDQKTADERIPLLLQTPAAIRWISYEPALEPVDFRGWLGNECEHCGTEQRARVWNGLSWVVVGGESGSGARPFDIEWARQTVEQCKAAAVPVFVKQLGARPVGSGQFEHESNEGYGTEIGGESGNRLRDCKGGDMEEWPADLRVREYPSMPKELREA